MLGNKAFREINCAHPPAVFHIHYTSIMNLGTVSRNYLFVFFITFSTFHFTLEYQSSTSENDGKKEVINFKVNVKRLKREIRLIPEDLSPVDGRTHRASEPLDPSKPVQHVNPFQEFDTVNTIFEPKVEGEDEEDEINEVDEDVNISTPNGLIETTTETVRQDEVQELSQLQEREGEPDENDNDEEREYDERQYAAQYPYSQSSASQEESRDAEERDPRRFYPGDLDRSPYQRGIVLPYASVPQSTPRTVTQSNRRQSVDAEGEGYDNRGYQTGYRPYSGNSQERPVTRGAPYNGPVYVDSRGHYVDAEGRHLDSTGRYYDVSGRYQDAAVTRTVSYHNSGPVYTQSSRGSGNQYNQYSESGTPGRGAPLDSYGGNQFYQTGSRRYPASYDPIVSKISDDPNCPNMNVQVTINGLTCNNAVSQLGPFVCYNYERVSTECCQRCLQVKRRDREGCEYGDRSNQCRNIQPFNCYDDRNRQICCDRCRQILEQRGMGDNIYQSREQLISRCSFDDITPRCEKIRQRPHLCYLPKNQRLCCRTCPRLANNAEPECRWGDQSPEMCQPFDANRRLKLNCYISAVQDICCATCKSLRERMPEQIPGCEYGDAPTFFRTGRGLLNCGEFIRRYGSAQCNSYQTATKCCYTCHRYLNRRQG